MPKLFDEVYKRFPGAYNKIGSYGRIGAVKGLQKKKVSTSGSDYHTPFYQEECQQPVPDGFIYPMVYGLRALMKADEETGKVEWATDPYKFVASDVFEGAVTQYCGVIQQSDYDSQKVGKGSFSYTSAENAVKLAYMLGDQR